MECIFSNSEKSYTIKNIEVANTLHGQGIKVSHFYKWELPTISRSYLL